ncbi:MAG TPA: hypothetical protein VLJ60_04220, partial [bacterium]|nr:hypothetical protein [bacterium]
MRITLLMFFVLSIQTLSADYLFEKDLVVIGKGPAAMKTFFSVEADSMLLVNELQTNSSFRMETSLPENFKILEKMDRNIFWGSSVQNLKPVEGGVVITIEFAGEIGKIFSKTVVLAENTQLGKALIEKEHQSGPFQRYFSECYDDFRIVEPAENIFLANPETFFVTEKNNPELLAGMMVSNLVRNKLNGKTCIFPDGISIAGIPTDETMKHIKKIKPKMFGLVGDKSALDWITDEKNTKKLGYNFERFFGSWSFEFLKNLKNEDISNIDMLGYCPQFNEISEELWAERIDFLKERFKNTKLLVGPCVDLYGTINQKTNSADYSGFEIKNEKIGKYMNGDYDGYIENTLKNRNEIGVFITYYEKFINPEEFIMATEKIMRDRHLFGVTTHPDNYFLFELMYQNSCRKVADFLN